MNPFTDLNFDMNLNLGSTVHDYVMEWISLELNIYISILFLLFEIDLAFI